MLTKATLVLYCVGIQNELANAHDTATVQALVRQAGLLV